MVTIDFETFIEKAQLPDGLRFKEWSPGCKIALNPTSEGAVYVDAHVAAIERISDGALARLEVTRLAATEQSSVPAILMVSAAEMAAGVDKAIEELTPSRPLLDSHCTSFWAARRLAREDNSGPSVVSFEFRVESVDKVWCLRCQDEGRQWSGTPEQAIRHAKRDVVGHKFS